VQNLRSARVRQWRGSHTDTPKARRCAVVPVFVGLEASARRPFFLRAKEPIPLGQGPSSRAKGPLVRPWVENLLRIYDDMGEAVGPAGSTWHRS